MIKSFRCAVSGALSCVRTERNMRFHLAVAFYVILAGFVTRLSVPEWAAILTCIALVLGAELLNTAIERLCNVVHPGYSKGIGAAKDTAAGAVLVCAIVSATIGSIVFFNTEKFSLTAKFVVEHPVLSVLIVLTVPLQAIFVFRRRNNDQ